MKDDGCCRYKVSIKDPYDFHLGKKGVFKSGDITRNVKGFDVTGQVEVHILDEVMLEIKKAAETENFDRNAEWFETVAPLKTQTGGTSKPKVSPPPKKPSVNPPKKSSSWWR